MERSRKKSQGLVGEEGSALLVVLVLLVLITIIGLSSVNNASMEMKIAGNDRVAKRNFYNAEAGLFDAVAMFDRIYDNAPDKAKKRLYPLDADHPPLRDQDPTTAGVAFLSPIKSAGGIPVAWVEVRAIVLKANKMASELKLSEKADEIPSLTHIGKAQDGYDAGRYCSRRYAVTATAIDPTRYDAANIQASLTGVCLQSGVLMTEETLKVEHWVGI